ncbi:hypothetical protein [Algibacter pacificus]|uniref:hypothetical protein n=1 Tax=Algibacter pacificus TaxID=2599389 RepID=UPI00164FB620|nr:hypothetical protein [Algibacter pacificus]
MKKLILTVAIVASGFSTFALVNHSIENETIAVSIADEFKEIALENLPETITAAMAKDFPQATINKAYLNSNEQYKLEFTIDGTENIVYADKDGNWLKEADVMPKKEETTEEEELEPNNK